MRFRYEYLFEIKMDMKKEKNTLLWKVTTANIAPSYLFGTMHVRDNRAFREIDFLKNRIAACQVFAAEYNLEDNDIERLQEATQLPEGCSLQSMMKPKHFEKLAKIVKKETAYDIALFNYKSPILLHNLLAEAYLGKEQDEPLDAALFSFAQQQGLELTGLESFEGQMAVFDKLDLKEQIKSLKDLAMSQKKYHKNLKKTTDLYVQGNIYKLLKKVKKTAAGMRKVLLYDRNIKMAEEFDKIAKSKSLFAAVGAGHLAGKKGVLNLLKKRGLKVKPVFY